MFSLLRKIGRIEEIRPVLHGAGLVLFVQIAGSGLSYLLQVLLARWIGAFEFGVYVFAWTVATLIPVLGSLGLGQSVLRFVPEYAAREEWGRLRGIIGRSQLLVLAGTCLVALAGLAVVRMLGAHVPPHYVVPLQIALATGPLLSLLSLLSEMSRGLGRALLSYVPPLLVRPGLLLAAVATVVALDSIPSGAGVLWLALFACAATVVGQAWLFRRRIPKAAQTAGPVYTTRHWLRVSLPLFIADGVFVAFWNVDTLMIGALLAPGDVAFYGAAGRTAGLVLFFFHAMTALAVPKFAALYALGEKEKLQAFVRSVAQWIFWPSLTAVLGLVVAGRFILGLFGPEFADAYPVLLTLATGFLIWSATGPADKYLVASGHQDNLVLANGSAAALNLILNVILIPTLGIMGAATATLLSILFLRLWLYAVVRRRLGIESLFFTRGARP